MIATFNFPNGIASGTIIAISECQVTAEIYHTKSRLQLGLSVKIRLLDEDGDLLLNCEGSICEITNFSDHSGFSILTVWVAQNISLSIIRRIFVTSDSDNLIKESRAAADAICNYLSIVSDEFKIAVINFEEPLRIISEHSRDLLLADYDEHTIRAKISEWTAGPLINNLNIVIRKLESAIRTVESTKTKEHILAFKIFAKKRLEIYLRSSAFLLRVLQKPKGWDGDVLTVKAIIGNRFDPESSLLGATLTKWVLSQEPAVAHRARIDKLTKDIALEAERCIILGHREMHILSLGCGPAEEVFRFLTQNEVLCREIRIVFHLVDFDPDIENFLKERMRREFATSNAIIDFNCLDIHRLPSYLKNPSDNVKFDLCYCAGFLDYVKDGRAIKILDKLCDSTSPGGLAIATNISNRNPLALIMKWVLNWNLEHRSSEDLLRMISGSRSTRIWSSIVESDWTGVNLFLRVRLKK
jgi:SAM-dependent methyltransferase